MPAAYQAALAAAETAENALAFEQAAVFYLEAMNTGQANESALADLHRKRAEALANAGRGWDSATVLFAGCTIARLHGFD